MAQPIKIIEIGERPPTGVSSCPFRCVGEDGHAYYVKLGTALPDEKINEWMFGFLALKSCLPTPVGAVVSVDIDLSTNSLLDTSEFGHGIGYGSREVASAHELTSTETESIGSRLRAEILLFDWWILNEDRKLGQFGGNPNILVSGNGEISLIDHGNSMDKEFDEIAFFNDHAFAKEITFWNNAKNRKEWEESARAALKKLPGRWEFVPENWLNSGATLKLEALVKRLERVFDHPKSFWKPFD